MSHEITSTDNLVLHKEKAWHGLGTVVEHAPTPREALEIAGLDWQVNQSNGVRGTMPNGDMFHTDKWVLNIRSDTSEVLGCVSENYVPVQNDNVAEFCEQLSMDTVVKVESAGSLFGGKRLWFLLKADTFNVGEDFGKDDPVVPYVLVVNSHDSSLAFSARPTSVRVVCNNTLSWAMDKKENVFSLRHTGSILERVDSAREKLKAYLSGLNDFKESCKHLRKTTMNRFEIEQFFLQMYEQCVDFVPPKDSEEEDKKREKALKSILEISNKFDAATHLDGPTYWNAFNSASQWLQSRQNSKNEDTVSYNKVMGDASTNTSKAFKLARTSAASAC